MARSAAVAATPFGSGGVRLLAAAGGSSGQQRGSIRFAASSREQRSSIRGCSGSGRGERSSKTLFLFVEREFILLEFSVCSCGVSLVSLGQFFVVFYCGSGRVRTSSTYPGSRPSSQCLNIHVFCCLVPHRLSLRWSIPTLYH